MGRGITSIGPEAKPITNEKLTFEADFSNINALQLFGPQGFPWHYKVNKGVSTEPGTYVTQLPNDNGDWVDVSQSPSGLSNQVDINGELQYYCKDHEVAAYSLPAMRYIENGELVLKNHLTPDNFKDVAMCAEDVFGDYKVIAVNKNLREITVEGRRYNRKRPSDDGSYERGNYVGFQRYYRDELTSDPDLDLSWKRRKYDYAWVNVQPSQGRQYKVKYEAVIDTLAVDPTLDQQGSTPTTHIIRIMDGELSDEAWAAIAEGGYLKLFRRLPWIGQMMTTGGTFAQKYFICETKMKLANHAEQFFALWFWGCYLKMFNQEGFPQYDYDAKHVNGTELDAIENPGGGNGGRRYHNLHAAGVGGMYNYAELNGIENEFNKGMEWDSDVQAGHQNYIGPTQEGYVNYNEWFTLQVRWIPPYHPDNLRKIGVVQWYIAQGDNTPRYLCGAITPPWWDKNPGLAKQIFINCAVGGEFVNDNEFVYAVNDGSSIRTPLIENRIKYIKIWQYPGYIAGGAGYPDKSSNFSRGMLPTPFDATGGSGTGVVPYAEGEEPVIDPDTETPVIDPATGRVRTLIKHGSIMATNEKINVTVTQLQETISALKIDLEGQFNSKLSTEQFQRLLNELKEELETSIADIQSTSGTPGLSAYDLWLTVPGNENKTLTEYFVSLKGTKGDTGTGGSTPLSSNPDLNDGAYAADTVATQILAERIVQLQTATATNLLNAINAADTNIRGNAPEITLESLKSEVNSTYASLATIMDMLTTDVVELDTLNERISVIQALIDDVNALGQIPDGLDNIIEELVNLRTDKGLPDRVPSDGFPIANLNYYFTWAESGTVGALEVKAGQAYVCKVDATPANTPANWKRAYAHDFPTRGTGTKAEMLVSPVWYAHWYVETSGEDKGNYVRVAGEWEKDTSSNSGSVTSADLFLGLLATSSTPLPSADKGQFVVYQDTWTALKCDVDSTAADTPANWVVAPEYNYRVLSYGTQAEMQVVPANIQLFIRTDFSPPQLFVRDGESFIGPEDFGGQIAAVKATADGEPALRNAAIDALINAGPFADDAAAATGGVAVGGYYVNTSNAVVARNS